MTYISVSESLRIREEERLAALRSAGKMRRLRVISDGAVLGSIEWPTGYVGAKAMAFRLVNGDQVAFNYAPHQINEDREPVADIHKHEDAGYFTIEVFLDLPAGWVDRLAEFPGWKAVRPKRVIELGEMPL